MKTTRKIVTASVAEIQGEKISSEDLAKSQWALIHDLERRYSGKTVPGTNCKFEDDSWFSTDSPSTSSRRGINWQLLETGEPALQILAKTYLFDAIFERRIEIATAQQKFRNLRISMIPLIENKNLLTGKDGSVLLGLKHLTDDDWMLMLDTLLVSQTSKVKADAVCFDIAAFHTFANHIAEQIPVYLIRARLPWQKSGESIKAWVKKRAADISIIFSETEGYEPLSSETMQPLVERSLTLIDLYFDHFAAIAAIVVGHDDDTKYERKFVLELLQKYDPIFSPIMAAPNISEKTGTKEKARSVLGWLRELLYLARGACVNVILLTTGLRNGDVRGLLVDTCRPSERVDMLFYLRAEIQKTQNVLIVPVPGQTDKAIRLLVKIKFTESSYLLDAVVLPTSRKGTRGRADTTADIDDDAELWLNNGDLLNIMIRDFAAHFNIPFISPTTGSPYSAHCYRTTVAGWLGAASNLSLLLVRRLFGHSNNVMPTVYLNSNPAFVAEREAQKARAHAETARQMGLAASQGRLAGIKGEQLLRGYQAHKSRMEAEKQGSHSLTDAEILMTFNQILEQRINSGSVCAFLTPFGVQCMRNPSDTSQPPCAKRANRNKTQDIDPELLKHVSDINPQQCIGTSCTEAVLGPWSTSVLETLNWYRALLSHQLGDAFTEEHFIESAKQFIQQYQGPLRKVFGIAALSNDPESAPSGEKVVQDNV
jgi:integrase